MYREIASRIQHALGSDLEDQLMQAIIDDTVLLKGPAWVAQAIKYYALSAEDEALAHEMVRAEIRAEQQALERIFDGDRASDEDRRLTIEEVINMAASIALAE